MECTINYVVNPTIGDINYNKGTTIKSTLVMITKYTI